MKMSEGPSVRETQIEMYQSRLTMCSPRRGSCFESKSEYVTEELCMRCCNKDERTKIHVKHIILNVFRGLKRESDGVDDCERPGIWMTPSYAAFTDSESTIGSKEVGRVGEVSNTMDSTSVVEFDTRVLLESRQMDIDFVNQLHVKCKRPRQWASSFPVIPTKFADVNGGGVPSNLSTARDSVRKTLNG